jgi:hypothetical protein
VGHEETREEFLQRKYDESMERIRYLRSICPPPARMDQSEE